VNDDHDDVGQAGDDGAEATVVTIDGPVGTQPPAPDRPRWPRIGPPSGA
jgi:hypothetical protein